ncbi:MAG: hypothetical protein WCL44_10495 [bacterium]
MVCVMAASSTRATPVVGSITNWNTGGLAGWSNSAPLGTAMMTLTNLNEGGGQANFLRMAFPAIPMSITNDMMYSSLDAYTGDLTGMGIRFDFRSFNYIGSTTLRFKALDGDIWDWSFDSASENLWETFDTSFLLSEGWDRFGDVESDALLLADLSTITAIGIYVQTGLGAMDTQFYDLDDWEYWETGNEIPEPGAVCMLCGLLLSFALVQRKRLRELYLQRAA